MKIQSQTPPCVSPLRQPIAPRQQPLDSVNIQSSGAGLVAKAAVVTVTSAIGYGLGQAASGGFSGVVVGGLLGLGTGTVLITPMGNGKGAEGLAYLLGGAVLGTVAGGVAGGFGIPYGGVVGAVAGAAVGLTLVH